jgi:hypothetical protein
MIDPFSDEADPQRLDGSLPPRLHEPMCPDVPVARLAMGRRPLLLGIALLPAALSLSACVQKRPACPTKVTDPHHCQHRFCRYHRR